MESLFRFFIFGLIFSCVTIISRFLLSPIVTRIIEVNQKRSEDLANKMDGMYMRVKVDRVALVFFLGPVILGAAGALLFPKELRFLGVLAGVLLGFIVPGIYVRALEERRRNKFEDQLIDTLMIMSSSLKGGLSLIQALEVVTEEMPEPMNQEVGILLGENKMGVSLEDAFTHLIKRMPSMALHQMITAILLARETGGNLPIIFSRIIQTIRENKKVRENLKNLTLQGKIQGGVMTLLPIAFALIVLSSNPHFFDVMTKSEMGRTLLIICCVLQVVGTFLIWKISKFKDF